MEATWVDLDKQLDTLFDTERHLIYSASYNYKYTGGVLVKNTQIPTVYNKYSGGGRRSTNRFKDLPFYPYGDDNKYPQFLLDLIQKSTLHRTAWKSASNIAYGLGWTYSGERGLDFYNWAKSKGLDSGFTMDLFKNIALFGGGYVRLNFIDPKEVNGNRVTQRRELYKVTTEKFHEIRVGKEEESGLYIDDVAYYWHHPEFSADSFKKDLLQGIPRYFSIEDIMENPRGIVNITKSAPYYESSILNQGKYLMPIGRPALTSGYYPAADYEANAALDTFLVDEALAAFDVAGLKNGLVANYIVTIPVSGLEKIKRTDPERAEEIVQAHASKIASELEGAENNKRTLVFVQDVGTKDHKPASIQITEIPHTNNEGIQKAIEERKAANILTAWHVTDSRLIGAPQLAGQGFANQAETLKTSWELWYSTFIYPNLIIPVLDFVNNDLRSIYQAETGVDLGDSKLFLLRHSPFTPSPSENILREILTLNELRQYYGFEPYSDEDYFLRDAGVSNQFNNNNNNQL